MNLPSSTLRLSPASGESNSGIIHSSGVRRSACRSCSIRRARVVLPDPGRPVIRVMSASQQLTAPRPIADALLRTVMSSEPTCHRASIECSTHTRTEKGQALDRAPVPQHL